MSVSAICHSVCFDDSEYPFVCPASPPPGHLIERRLLPTSLFCDEELSEEGSECSSDVACNLFGNDFSESDNSSSSLTEVDCTNCVVDEEEEDKEQRGRNLPNLSTPERYAMIRTLYPNGMPNAKEMMNVILMDSRSVNHHKNKRPSVKIAHRDSKKRRM